MQQNFFWSMINAFYNIEGSSWRPVPVHLHYKQALILISTRYNLAHHQKVTCYDSGAQCSPPHDYAS